MSTNSNEIYRGPYHAISIILIILVVIEAGLLITFFILSKNKPKLKPLFYASFAALATSLIAAIIVYSLATSSGSGLTYTGYNPSKYNTPSTSAKTVELREEAYVDGILYKKESDQNAYYVATATDNSSLTPDVPERVIVRDNIDGYPVVRIGQSAFSSNNVTTYVGIPDSVKTIGVSAFSGCKKLQTVYIGNGTQYINAWAFYNCRVLQTVYIGSGVTNIGEYSFSVCDNLSEIIVTGSQHWKGYYYTGSTNLVQEIYSSDSSYVASQMTRFDMYQWVRQFD